MIKIELSEKQKEEIEKIFLKDVFGDDEERKDGSLVKILKEKKYRRYLKRYHIGLYDYFYDTNGRLNNENVKTLLLADRTRMKELIAELGSYDSTNSKKKPSAKLLNKIFMYDNFSRRKVVYEIFAKLGITVCPYCNRTYISTLSENKVRPQIDHYFSKMKYPYLSLSLYNLIPSCSICNQAKSDMDMIESPILYPYEEEFGEKIVFTIDIKNVVENEFVKFMTGKSDKFMVDIENPEHILAEQVNNQKGRLHIVELYNEHKDYIVDIFKSYHINTAERVKELKNQFPYLFSTEEEIRGLMFMTDLRKENWGKRPLAKLTHDIFKELDNLSG